MVGSNVKVDASATPVFRKRGDPLTTAYPPYAL